MAGSNPNNNGFTGKDTTGFVDQEVTSSLDSLRKEAMSVEWTDEKHSLYLESMETSFVDQLYNSMNFLGWQWQKEHRSAAISSMHMKSRTSGQFKVHQDGSWQRINFERGEHLLEEADGRDILLANPWIRHFRGGCRQDVPFATYQQNIASRSQQVSYGRKKELACGLVNKSEPFPVCSHHQYPLNSNEEVSDQNFVDEDDEERKDHHIHGTKRLKSSPASSNEQSSIGTKQELQGVLTSVQESFTVNSGLVEIVCGSRLCTTFAYGSTALDASPPICMSSSIRHIPLGRSDRIILLKMIELSARELLKHVDFGYENVFQLGVAEESSVFEERRAFRVAVFDFGISPTEDEFGVKGSMKPLMHASPLLLYQLSVNLLHLNLELDA